MHRPLLAAGVCLLLLAGLAPPTSAQQGNETPPLADLIGDYTHDGPPIRPAAPAVAARAAVPDDCVVTGNVRLDRDLDCTILVRGDGITVDLNGFSIGGLGLDGDRLTIKNGTITGPVYLDLGSDNVLNGVTVRGVSGFAVTLGCGDLVINSRFIDNEIALDQYFCGDTEIRNSTFIGNRLGVLVANNAGDIINGNRFERNDVGVLVWDEDGEGTRNTLVKRNTFDRNDIGVFLNPQGETTGTRIVRNDFLRNTSSGIVAQVDCYDDFGCATGTRIQDNRMIGNGRAPVGRGWHDDDTGQSFLYTPDDGLTVVGPPRYAERVTLARNVTVNNADLGIDAPGVTDGRGNRARNNGDPAQCIGVVCRP